MSDLKTDTVTQGDDEDLTAEDVVEGLSDEDISETLDALESEDFPDIEKTIQDLTPAEIAELLAKIGEEERHMLLDRYGATFDPLVFLEMDPELRRVCLERMAPEWVARIVSELETDDALDLILPLDEDLRREIIKKLSYKDRLALEEGFSFPEDSAGRLMQREFVAIPQFWTVGKTIDYLRAASEDLPDDFFDLFVVDPAHHVIGEIPLSRIIRARRSEKIDDLMLEETYPIPATMDQEEVAILFRREDLTSGPVVDEEGRLIGVITVDDIVDVITEEAQEDFLKLGGVEQGDMYRAALTTSGYRFRWLFVNLLTAILASVVISFFEATIEQLVALAVLMPIVASMGGNAGTQALTVAVRALATRELSGANAMRVVWKETLVGAINGSAFAVLTGLVAGLWFSDPMLGCVIGAAMVVNLVCAGTFGALIPILLDKAGTDPAVSSSVFVTTVTDVVGFFAFLGLAAIFMI
ncbi:MAG TPA: magnesium transporter [Alphaproteobacteria bacterium]|nr:magnesium transporter [Alphaproteobacteria bacterium]